MIGKMMKKDEIKYTPRIWIDLLEFHLVLCNWLSLSIEYQETRAGSALVDGPDEFRRAVVGILPIVLSHNLEARTFRLFKLVESCFELGIALLQRKEEVEDLLVSWAGGCA